MKQAIVIAAALTFALPVAAQACDSPRVGDVFQYTNSASGSGPRMKVDKVLSTKDCIIKLRFYPIAGNQPCRVVTFAAGDETSFGRWVEDDQTTTCEPPRIGDTFEYTKGQIMEIAKVEHEFPCKIKIRLRRQLLMQSKSTAPEGGAHPGGRRRR